MNKDQSVKPKKVFKNFEEYWSLVKILSEDQRVILTDNLSPAEQRSLKLSFEKGGWQELFMRNLCDHYLDDIKRNFKVDLIEIRASVMSGSPYLVDKEFWNFVNEYFEPFDWEDIAFIFDGVVAKPHDEKYVKLVRLQK